ncbi:MAG: hypothetical protein KDA99_30920, partial [Planctomycetales bacterium]|nr:hypothetical protein [Planctomycetales bacterium]
MRSLAWVSITFFAASALSDGRETVMRQNPRARCWQGDPYTRVFFGPMTRGETPDSAASAWLARHAVGWNENVAELEVMRSAALQGRPLHVIAYQQRIDGIRVEGAQARIVVRTDRSPQVVLATARLAPRPSTPFATPRIDSVAALRAIEEDQTVSARYHSGTDPELVIRFMDETGYHEPALSWVSRVAARDGSEVARVYVNPDTGCVTAVESDTHHATLTGRVLGRATVGLAAIEVSGTDLVPIPDIEVFVTGGVSPASGFTDRNGYYSINVDGAGPFSIATSSEDAQYRSVVNYVDGNNPRILAASKTWTSADPNLVLNDVNDPNVAQTAVVNALVHYHEARNFFESRWSLDVLGFNHQIRVNHVPSGCGLGNSGSPNLSPMLLYRELTGCRNGAMSTVIAHEFGHLVQASLGLSREQVFGESVGDTIAFLLYNTEVFASEVHPGQGADRTPLCPRRDYLYNPTLDAHLTSMILSGLWLDIRREIEVSGGESISCSVMDSSFDPNDPNCVSACVSRTASEGNEFVSQLFVDWTQLTLGPIREPGLVHSRPAHFGTAIEILTVLDDDGDLSNGGPHYAEIEAAFDLHQIPFPSIDPVRFFFPEGRPSVVRPNIPLDFQVVVVYPEANEPTDLSAALELGYCNSCNAVTDFNDLETGQVSLVDGNCPLTGLGFDPNELAAGLTHAAYCLSLPATDCGDGIAFGLRFALENDATFVSPTDAVHRLHRATPGWGRRTEVVWDMEQVSIGDPNWRVDPNEPNGLDFGPLASLGTWQIGVPDIYLDLSGAL